MKPFPIRVAATFGAVLFLALPACTASSDGSGDESVEEQTDDVTSSYVFHCRAAHGVSGAEIAKLRISRTRATFTALDVNLDGAAAVYTYNANYRPRAASHQGDVQYAFTDSGMHKTVLLFEPTMRTGGSALAGGGHGGEVVVEGPRIPHTIKSMFCRR